MEDRGSRYPFYPRSPILKLSQAHRDRQRHLGPDPVLVGSAGGVVSPENLIPASRVSWRTPAEEHPPNTATPKQGAPYVRLWERSLTDENLESSPLAHD